MKLKKSYINVMLLMLGVFSMQLAELNSFPDYTLFQETAVEESVDDFNELTFSPEYTDADADGNGNAIVPAQHLDIKNPHYDTTCVESSAQITVSHKPHFYILYCSLKVDC